jgi:hypothetical protein
VREPMLHLCFAALVAVITGVAVVAIATTIKRDLALVWEP